MLKLKDLITEAPGDGTALGTNKVIGLSKIDPKVAKAAWDGGTNDGDPKDDVVAGKKVPIAVGALKPAQSELIKAKAFGMVIDFVLRDKWQNADLGNIVSSDNYIMDGHHRWAAIILINPKAKANVTQIDLPGQALVTTLNLITVGKLNITKGNDGSGNIAEFTGANFEAIIDEALTNGIPGKFPKTPEEVAEAIGKIPGANGDAQAGKAIVMKNADKMPTSIMPGAPKRVEMPVIDEDKIAMVVKQLKQGALDIQEPFSQGVTPVSGDEDVQEDGYKPKGNALKERFQKIANIIKG
tara:strand:- start:1310 stop:2200 length:891 start_codon:yes stop_codon:yes gene_type:complete